MDTTITSKFPMQRNDKFINLNNSSVVHNVAVWLYKIVRKAEAIIMGTARQFQDH